MIYLIVPTSGAGVRIVANYGLMEQIVRAQPMGWCTVFGYELAIDEYQPMWIWKLGVGGILSRSPAKS
jgi:hypothetical protein